MTTREEAMLAKIYVEITNVCNLQCAFCPGTKRAPRQMSPEEFSRLAPEIKKVTSYVYFHVMGEPLSHPRLADFLQLAHANGLRVILTTNGTLLPACQALLLSQPALHKVNISLHAMEANGCFSPEGYLRGCCEFAKAACRKEIICNLRLWNLDGMQQGMNQANARILQLLHEHFPGEWEENTKGFCMAPKVFLEWGERFEWPDDAAPDYGESGFCRALRDQAGILSDGTVIPCCLDHEGTLALGNAFETPLHEILNSPPARAIYDGFSRRVRHAALCRHCGYAQRFSK